MDSPPKDICVTCYIRKPDTPQIRCPRNRYVISEGYCERHHFWFDTIQQANDWLAQHPEAHDATIEDQTVTRHALQALASARRPTYRKKFF